MKRTDLQEPWTGTCVKVREHNGYDDSDWIATYYDGEKFVEALCGSTRFAFPVSATVDATPEIFELWRIECERRKEAARIEREKAEAENPTVGKRVEVVKGRKYKGLVGEIFWRGVNQFRTYYKNGYNDPDRLYNQTVGVKTEDGTKFFVPADYVAVI